LDEASGAEVYNDRRSRFDRHDTTAGLKAGGYT
jgi:hypothetical protein